MSGKMMGSKLRTIWSDSSEVADPPCKLSFHLHINSHYLNLAAFGYIPPGKLPSLLVIHTLDSLDHR